MDLKQIKELMTAMGRAGIKKLSIKEKTGYELSLERHEEQPVPPQHTSSTYAHPPLFSHVSRGVESHPLPHAHAHPKPVDAAPVQEKEGHYVTAPLVGTYYNASSPDAPPFAKVGDRVEENTVLCIIEAMKVMNEVKAGVSGVIQEIFIDNAHPVEFGTKIFRIL